MRVCISNFRISAQNLDSKIHVFCFVVLLCIMCVFKYRAIHQNTSRITLYSTCLHIKICLQYRQSAFCLYHMGLMCMYRGQCVYI